jgi:Flp pilus assembly protein TadD
VIIFAKHPENDKLALELATKAREALPNDAELAKAFGILLYRQGNHSRAAALLQESARSRMRDGELMYYLGMAQRKLNDEAASNRSLARALELGLPAELETSAKRLVSVSVP